MITDISKLNGLSFINSDTTSDFQTNIINQKEPELLKAWFGYALAKDLLDTPSTEAQSLIDGFEYTDDNGDLQEVVGLKDFLQYFMYFYIVRDEQSNNTSLGQQEALAENSAKTSPNHKLCENYNKGVLDLNWMLKYVNDHEDDYPHAIINCYVDDINLFGI